MKKIFCVVAMLITSITVFGQQQKSFQDLLTGSAYMSKEIYASYPLSTVWVSNKAANINFEKKAVVMGSKETYGTVLVINMSENLCYIAGFLPLVKDNKFTGIGEFYLYKKENGIVSKEKYFFASMRKEASNNEIIEYLETPGYVAGVRDKMEVSFMFFNGYGFAFPSGYF